MKVALIIIAVFVVLLALLMFGGGYYMYRFAICRNRWGQKQINYWEDGAEEKGIFTEMKEEVRTRSAAGAQLIKSSVSEKVTITSHDGLKLCGHIVENFAGRGVAILFHGYRSGGTVDFSWSADQFFGRGFSLLFVDQRGTNESEGKHICFGALERYDAVEWAKYAEERWPGKPVVMAGISMGASTVMMGAGVGYPSNVKAILADCGFTTPGEIARKCMKQWYKLPAFPVYYGAKLWTKWLAKFDLDGVNSRDSLAKLRGTGIKVLIAHGTADDFVPYRMSEENIKAFDYMPESARRETLEFLSVKDAGHGVAYTKDEQGYLAAFDRLLAKAGI